MAATLLDFAAPVMQDRAITPLVRDTSMPVCRQRNAIYRSGFKTQS